MVLTMKNITRMIAFATAVLTVSSVPVLAYDKGGFSFNTGKSSYSSWQAEHADEYASAEDEDKTGYSFYTGTDEASAREDAFTGLSEDAAEEEAAAFFAAYGFGSDAYASDDEWDADVAASSYGYAAGRQAYTQRHQVWE